ncbi:hypothetical protein BDZ45DRAFT_751099 [Acephala macrosclerotiorum]|nr:hypothetical protein BDZ45DRAFT_751099 [Acephala macrosclerotiorum]
MNVFSLSGPLNIFLLYFLTLRVTVPFMAMGILALLKMVTVPWTAVLFVARYDYWKRCLGGYENVSETLYELTIQFGELIKLGGSQDQKVMPMPRRACFGIDGEVRGLRRENIYGIDR